jgi:transcriptional regulator GlxA family with amidase domain
MSSTDVIRHILPFHVLHGHRWKASPTWLPKSPHLVAILAPPGVQLLDVSGPLDVFAEANLEAGREAYALRIVACESRARAQFVGGAAAIGRRWRIVRAPGNGERIDTLLVAGAPNAPASCSCRPRTVLDWLRDTARRARRHGSVCTGAFALAQAGCSTAAG